jgi:hypothetical protein
MLGLVLGGALASVSWRLTLFLPAALGAGIAVVARLVLPADQPRAGGRVRVDVGGAVAVTAGVLALVYAVSHAAVAGWTTGATIGSLAAALLLLTVFVQIERVHPAPLVPLEIFTRPNVSRANVCMLFQGAYVGFQFVATLYYQDELGWSPLRAGLGFLVGGLIVAVAAQRFAAVVTRYGAWPLATAGLLLQALSYLWFLQLDHVNVVVLVGVQQVLGGIGFAATYPAMNISAVGGARADEQGVASGLFIAAAQIGSGVVLGVTASVFTVTADAGLGGYRGGLWTIAGITGAVALLAATGIRRQRGADLPETP